MADTRTTPKADDPASVTAAGLSTADITPAAAPPGGGPEASRAGDILKAGKDEALTEAKTLVRDAAEEQRRRAASAVGGMAGALHRAASDLERENEMVGRYAHMAAQRLEQVAQYLRDSSLDDVLAGAEDMARRQPYWFVGGAMAAGFLLARMIKSSGAATRPGAATRYGQPMAAASAAGYGTSPEAGGYPPGAASTAPVSSAAPVTTPGTEA